MNKTFIWDIDGTLFDSYVSIVDSLYSLFHDVLKIDISKDEIYHKCIYGTVADFIKEIREKYNLKPKLHKREIGKIVWVKSDRNRAYYTAEYTKFYEYECRYGKCLRPVLDSANLSGEDIIGENYEFDPRKYCSLMEDLYKNSSVLVIDSKNPQFFIHDDHAWFVTRNQIDKAHSDFLEPHTLYYIDI